MHAQARACVAIRTYGGGLEGWLLPKEVLSSVEEKGRILVVVSGLGTYVKF